MKHLNLTKKYCEFIEEFHLVERIKFDETKTDISEAIFYHVFKVKQSLWKQMSNFDRLKRISTSDLLQDLIAYYLKATLPSDFKVVLEKKVGKLQPDILIEYQEGNLFIIEVKTTIGWDRNSIDGHIQSRIQDLSNTFQIPKNNIIYIFQSPWNVNKTFREKYWNAKENKPANNLDLEFPFNIIRPLFSGEDPFYYKRQGSENKYFDEEEIISLAKMNIVVPFEITISNILAAAQNASFTKSFELRRNM